MPFAKADSHQSVTERNTTPGGLMDTDADLLMEQGYYTYNGVVGGVGESSGRAAKSGSFPGSNKGRHQGICCGICATWLVGFLHGDKEARSFDNSFVEYWTNVLQFQGAFLKAVVGANANVKMPGLLEGATGNSKPKTSLNGYQGAFTQGLNRFGVREAKETNMLSTLMAIKDVGALSWGAYVWVWDHVIAIGRWSGYYYLLEPNYGLFGYHEVKDLSADLVSYQAKRRAKLTGPDKATKTFTLYLYKK